VGKVRRRMMKMFLWGEWSFFGFKKRRAKEVGTGGGSSEVCSSDRRGEGRGGEEHTSRLSRCSSFMKKNCCSC